MSERPNHQFTLSIVSENEVGALIRVLMTLARHRIAIESLTTTCGDPKGTSRHTVQVVALPDQVRRAMKQIGAVVGILAAEYRPAADTVDREIALYKVAVDGGDADSLREVVGVSRARILVRGAGHVILEKTGSEREVKELYELLEPFGILDFIRSGRVMVTRTEPDRATGVPNLLSTEVR